jgi:hypothetical protein
MRFRLEANGHLIISGVGGVELEFLRQVPGISRSEDPRAKARIYSVPGSEPDLMEDWEEFVRPDLEEHFSGALEVIESDLARVKHGKNGSQIEVVPDHWESWLIGLNQARLTLWAEHLFTDSEMAEEEPIADPARSAAFFAMNLYGFLQEVLLRLLEKMGDEEETTEE